LNLINWKAMGDDSSSVETLEPGQLSKRLQAKIAGLDTEFATAGFARISG
jgi:hypothetical protein